MGFFSPATSDRLAAIGGVLQGSPNAYAAYQQRAALEQAIAAQAQAQAQGQVQQGPVAATPDVSVNVPQMPQQQPPVDQVNMPQMAYAPTQSAPASAAPPSDPSGPPPAPIRTPQQPLPQRAQTPSLGLPNSSAFEAALPGLMESARYSNDPTGNISKLLQIKDSLARQRMFQNAYNQQIANGGQGGGSAGPGDPAMQDFRGIMPANQAEQMFDLAAATYGPDVANSMRENWKASQPTYTTIADRQYVNNGLNARSQVVLPKDGDGFTNLADANAPGGYRTVATPGWQAVNNSKAGGAALAGGIKPPVDGATPVVSGYDPVTGIPNVTGWRLPNGTVQAVAATASARAAGEGSAKPYAYTNGDGSQTLTNETEAATGRGGPGRHIGPTYGTKDTYEGAVKDYQALQADRDSAQTTIANVNQLNNLLGSMRTGKISPMGNELSAAAQAAGLPGEYRNLTNAQAITTINKNMIGELRKQAGMTRLTDADLKFLNAGLPGIGNTPEGNAAALSYMNKMAQRRVDRATAADNWVNKYGSLAAPGKGGPNFNAAWSVFQANYPVFAPRGGGR